jgi:hypothetical protein
MPRGFAENTSTYTRHRRAAQAARLSFDVDRLLGRLEIMPRGIKKKPRKMYSCIHTCAAWQKLLRLDASYDSRCSARPYMHVHYHVDYLDVIDVRSPCSRA